MKTVLEVKNLTKKFSGSAFGGGDFTAVDNISFTVSDGEILGLLGPNGAGKTTTIQMLLGVMDTTEGEITYFGKTFKKHREEILKNVNYSSTYISLPWWFTTQEILEVFGRLYEVPDRKKRIKKLLAEFELEHLKDKQFFMLSSGEKTRLLLTKSFINYPKILLLDEPTASLDVEIAVKVRGFLKKERKEYNVSMLFTSHDMSEIEEMCDRVIILKSGKVIAKDSPENLARNITQSEIVLFIKKDAQKALEFLKKTKTPFKQDRYRFTVTTHEKRIAEFLMLLAQEKIEYEEISINKPNLEDYFLQVIKEKNYD